MGKSKKKSKKKEAYDDDGNIKDERFQIAQTHPQFQKLHTNKFTKNKSQDDGGILISNEKSGGIDERFSAMLTDSRFAMGGDVGFGDSGNGDGNGIDKYGRKKKSKKKKKSQEDIEAVDNSDDVNK